MHALTTMSSAEVLELRQYKLHPGARSDLVELFERELIEPQEDAGMRVGGLFLDRDDPNRFVWMRGFADLEARHRALETFYYGPVWEQFRDAANATMVDSDDVLLLRPTDPERPAPEPAKERAGIGIAGPSDEWVTVSVYVHPPDERLTRWLTEDFHAALEESLGVPVGAYRTEPAANTFPTLPVRPDNVFVWTAGFPTQDDYDAALLRLRQSKAWQHHLLPFLEAELTARQCLRLQPTARSQHSAS